MVEQFAEVAGRERGVEIHLDAGRRAEFDGSGETLLPAAPQRRSGSAESGRHEDVDGAPEVRAGDQQVGIEERPMFRAVVVEVGVREPLEHERLDAGLGEHRDGGDRRGLGIQGTPQTRQVRLARTPSQLVIRADEPVRDGAPQQPVESFACRPSDQIARWVGFGAVRRVRGWRAVAGQPVRHHGPLVGSEGGRRGQCGSVGHVDRVVRSVVVVIRA